MSEEPELIEPFGAWLARQGDVGVFRSDGREFYAWGEPFDAWLARQSDDVQALSTLEQIDLYAEEME